MALVDYLLKIDGIQGESQDSQHKGEIQIDSFSFGVRQGGSFGSGHGGGGSGRAVFPDFSFVKPIDMATPKLFLACCQGVHIRHAVLTCRKAGKQQWEYLKVVLADCLVSSLNEGGPHAGVAYPTESVSLNYSAIEIDYKMQKPDGTLGASYRVRYDVKAMKAG
jgi:type VI secretion system secreted protein Hcp